MNEHKPLRPFLSLFLYLWIWWVIQMIEMLFFLSFFMPRSRILISADEIALLFIGLKN